MTFYFRLRASAFALKRAGRDVCLLAIGTVYGLSYFYGLFCRFSDSTCACGIIRRLQNVPDTGLSVYGSTQIGSGCVVCHFGAYLVGFDIAFGIYFVCYGAAGALSRHGIRN